MSSLMKKLKQNKDKSLKATREQMAGYKQKNADYKDERYWRPVLDNNGTGGAIIRFLPGKMIEGTDETEPTSVRRWSHGFKNKDTNLWYIENSRTTLGKDFKDPCTDYNSKLYKTEDEELIKQAKSQKRKLSYISNIYVVKHPARPDDEGKVFLYQYGQKIYDKVEFKVSPPEEDIEPVDVFDMWDGANFRLRVKKVENFPNYDDSSFDQAAPLFKDDPNDAKAEAVYKSMYSLNAEIAPDKFKSYEELEKRLLEVLGLEKDGESEEKANRQAYHSSAATERPVVSVKPKAKAVVEETSDDTPPWEDDKTVEPEVETKPSIKSSSGSAFFKKLKAQAQT